MMKKLLLKTMLLLCALIVGSGTMWGDDETIASGTFDGKNGNYTAGWSTTGTGKNRNDCIIIGSGENITSPTMDLSKYSKVTISIKARRYGSLSGSKATIDASIGGVSVGTTDATGTNATTSLTDIEFEQTAKMTSVAIVFTCTNATSAGSSHGAGVNTITITGTPATGGGDTPTLSDCDLALTGAPVALNFDLYNNSTAQVINYTTSSTGAVTIADNDYAEFDIDEENKTITVTPITVTPSAQTITVNQEADETYNAGSATFTLTITDSTPIPTYTATFSVNGVITSTQDYEEGADIVFPDDPADVNGKTFVGWVTEAIDGTTDDAPKYVPSAIMEDEDVTFYAVFAIVNNSGNALNKMQEGDTFAAGDKIVVVASTEDGLLGLYQETISNSYVKYFTFVEDYSTVVADDKNWWTVNSGSNGGWILGDATNGYLYNSSSNNLSVDKTNSSEWTLEDNRDNTFGLKSGRYLSCRTDLTGDNVNRFRMAGSNPAGVYGFTIFKLAGGITYSGYCTTVAAAVAVTDVSVDATASVNVGETTTLTATVSPDNATNKNVTWTSSDEAIATVNANGVVTGVAAGEATITVTSVADNTKTATCTVTVTTVAVTGVSVDATASVNVGKTTTLTAIVSPENATNKNVTWESSDEAIATVDENGVVTGVAAGEATITVTSVADNTKTATCTVTVSVAPGTAARPYTVAEALTVINALDDNGTIDGQYVSGKISQVVSYYNGAITYWISDDGTTTSQMQVYNGKGISGADFSDATDLDFGDVVVVYGQLKKYVKNSKTTPEFNSGSQLVSRTEKPASDLAKTSDIALDVKNNALTASVADYISSSSTGAYTYESADETVATVSAEGVVTGLKVGTTTITVNQEATLSYKAGSVEIPVTVADTRVDATTIPAINISNLSTDDKEGTISVVDPVKADEGVTFSFESSDEDVLLIEGDKYFVIGIGTTTVTVTATASNSDLYKDVTETFEVTVNAAVKSENVIALDFDSYSTVYGTNLEGLVSGSTGFDGEITATSSNPSVLTVAIDAEGNVMVTPVAVGSATVTFSAVETASFLAAENVQQVFTVTALEGKTTAQSANVTETFDFSKNGWGLPTSSSSLSGDYTKGGQTVRISGTGYYYGSKALLLGKSGAYVTLPAFTMPVTQIDVVGVEGASGSVKQNIFVGSTAVSTQTTGATTTNKYEIDSKYQDAGTVYSLKVTSAHNTQIESIVVHMYQAPTATVTLNKYGYATFCSVNPMDFSSTTGYTAWRVNEVASDGTITFKKVTEPIKGGQGVLLYNKDADGENTSDVTISFADGSTVFDNGSDGVDENDNLLFGTTAPTYIPANEYYGLAGNKFVRVNAGTVPAGKALLPASAIPAGARELKLVFEDENTTTGIRTIENAEMRTENAVYDLLGRKVTKPVKGGLYIENGLKFVKK